MAIIIPSKNIYGQPQNPKIRDNIIERIEIGAKEILPYNEYNTSVYNEDFNLSLIKKTSNKILNYKDAIATNQGADTARYIRGACYINYSLNYLKTPEILIPKVKGNKFISKLFDGNDELGNPKIQIGVTISNKTYTGYVTYNPYLNEFDFTNANLKQENEEKILYTLSSLSYNRDVKNLVSSLVVSNATINANHFIETKSNKLKISSYLYADSNFNWSPSSIQVESYVESPFRKNEILVSSTIINGIEYYKLSSAEVFCGVTSDFASCLIENKSPLSNINAYATATATKIVNECKGVSITVSGNTIGIDLKNKTIYINGQTAKKVHSVDGNELVQTTNYWQPTGENAVEKAFTETQKQYAKGKETATIKCAIGSYQTDDNKLAISENKSEILSNDFATVLSINSASNISVWKSTTTVTLKETYKYPIKVEVSYQWTDGKKGKSTVIFAPNEKEKTIIFHETLPLSTHLTKVEKVLGDLPMTFTEYDEVIPMVYGADGKDHPMSRYADGSPKVFKVLGMRPFYDGSVLQELYLQEK